MVNEGKLVDGNKVGKLAERLGVLDVIGNALDVVVMDVVELEVLVLLIISLEEALIVIGGQVGTDITTIRLKAKIK